MMRAHVFRNGLLVAFLNNVLFSPAAASWTALDLVTETPDQGQKLQHCQGHCRDDKDCEIGLKCVLRSDDDFEDVLEEFRCTGTLEYEVNYCVDTWWGHPSVEVEKPTEDSAPTTSDIVSNQTPSASADISSKEEDWADDIFVNVPSFILGISFNTPSRRQLGSLANNISPNSLESLVAYAIGEEMSKKYPDTFQDVDIMADLIAETEEMDITTLTYRCSSYFIFSSDEEHLPNPTDLYSIAIDVLNRDFVFDVLRSSNDIVLSAASDSFVMTMEEYYDRTRETPQASIIPPSYSAESESSPSVVMVVAGAGFVLLAILFLFVQKMNGKGSTDSSVDGCDSKDGASSLPTDALNSSLEDIEKSSISYDSAYGEGSTGDSSEDSLPGYRGTDPMAMRRSMQDATHEDCYEQRSDIGDRSIDSVGYSEAQGEASVAMDSVVGSVGRSDWSIMEGGGMPSGYSTADDSSFIASGKRAMSKSGSKIGPMLVRRNVELMGTIRALDEVEVHVSGENKNDEGSICESSLGGNDSLLEDVKARNVLQVDEIDTQVGGEDFNNVWKEQGSSSFEPKILHDNNVGAEVKDSGDEAATEAFFPSLNPPSAITSSGAYTSEDKLQGPES